MSNITSPIESDDSSALNEENPQSLRDVCGGLRRHANRATNNLSLADHKTIRKSGRRNLRELAQCVNAVDIHLFRVSVDETGSGRVGLKFHTGFVLSTETINALRKFQFRLLPTRVQDCLKQDQIAKIRGNSGGGGRALSALLEEMNCVTYYLCPLFVHGKVKGALGIACRQEFSVDDRFSDDFFELLKLNGTILLTNILRVRREAIRSRKLREWRRIADQACDFAISVDRRFVVSRTSAFGAGPKTPDLDGLRLTDIVIRSFHRDVLQQIKKAVDTSEVRTIDFQISLGHDGPRWCLARIEPSGRGSDAYATLYLTDNNPDKLLQEEIRELTDHLVKASRLSLLGQMSTEFAHQLNQPLQAILNYCNMMQRRIDRGTATEKHSITALANIENSVLHSANIIERIRDFVKFRTLLTEDVTLQELIEQALMMVIPTARAWNADVIPPEDALDLEVVVDKAQTTHVMVNLMINALEACREFGVDRPRIELFVREEADRRRVTVGVRDNGPGLPKDDPGIVFRKFYSGRDEGLGMGLAVSREVCESQGGSLTAENNSEGSGCTFFVTMELKNRSGSDTAELETVDVGELPVD